MANIFYRYLRKTKLKTFLFFLFVAVIFWVLTKFTREYSATVQAKIAYINLPENVMLGSMNKDLITFDVTANGFEFLFYKIKQPEIIIKVMQYYSEGSKRITLSKEELIGLITAQLNQGLSVKNLSVNELTINLDAVISKKVAIIPKIDFNFEKGFKPTDSIVVIPDSVEIYGPSGTLANINFIQTKTLTRQNIQNSVSEKVNLQFTNKNILKIVPSKVQINLTVQEFSEQQMVVPITVINAPPELNLKVIPGTVTIRYDVSVNDFNNIVQESFKVVCDFAERNQEENFMIPKIQVQPSGITNVTLDTDKIDFLIFK